MWSDQRFDADAPTPVNRKRQVMNMRAAEAIVSSAPKPMKIFPISEVWSQIELSFVIVDAATGAGGGLAVVGAAGAELPSCSERSTSLS